MSDHSRKPPKFHDGGFGAVDLRELFGGPRDPGKDGALGAPWTIGRDNAHGITILDRDGDVVWEELWNVVPVTQPNRDEVIRIVRRRIRCVVVAINCHERFVTAASALLAANDDPALTGLAKAVSDLAVLTMEAMTLAAEA